MFKQLYNATLGKLINPFIEWRKNLIIDKEIEEKAKKRDITLNHREYYELERRVIRLESRVTEEREVNKKLENDVSSLSEKLKDSEMHTSSLEGDLRRQNGLHKELKRKKDYLEEVRGSNEKELEIAYAKIAKFMLNQKDVQMLVDSRYIVRAVTKKFAGLINRKPEDLLNKSLQSLAKIKDGNVDVNRYLLFMQNNPDMENRKTRNNFEERISIVNKGYFYLTAHPVYDDRGILINFTLELKSMSRKERKEMKKDPEKAKIIYLAEQPKAKHLKEGWGTQEVPELP